MTEPPANLIIPLTSYRQDLDRFLNTYFEQYIAEADAIDPLYAELLTEISANVTLGGKRLRPYLAYLSYIGSGGKLPDAFLPLAASQELFHCWALVHDDVMDHDIKRHGKLNISGVYQQKLRDYVPAGEVNHTAASMAILAGDILSGLAFGLIADQRQQFDGQVLTLGIARMRQMLFEINAGQQLDILMSYLPAAEVSYERLLKVCQYKTASYSYESPMQFGAIMAGTKPEAVAGLLRFARPIGIAFQLADDILGMFGNEDKLGKSTLSDLREGKRTVLMAYARERMTDAQRVLMDQAFGNPQVDYAEQGTVRQILEDCGAKRATEDMAMHYVLQAKAALTTIELSDDVRHELSLLADFSFARQS